MKRMSESRMRDLVRNVLIESEIEQGDRYSVAIESLMRIIATDLIKVIVDSGFNVLLNDSIILEVVFNLLIKLFLNFKIS